MGFKKFLFLGVFLFVVGYFFVVYLSTLSQNTINLLWMLLVSVIFYLLMIYSIYVVDKKSKGGVGK